ncbi:MAG TPA: dihydrofolate reductase family protein, partial [Chloroflexota bacterium]|nr:dihydrofolate reductase family protein [Chloroflexota bacterium]
LERADWENSTIIRGDLADAVRRLKERIDGDILINGSGQLVQTLMAHDLIDEFRLMVFPSVLGSGRRLFADTSKSQTLRPVEARQASGRERDGRVDVVADCSTEWHRHAGPRVLPIMC